MFSMEFNCFNLGCLWNGKFCDFEVLCFYLLSLSLGYYRKKLN